MTTIIELFINNLNTVNAAVVVLMSCGFSLMSINKT